MKKDKPKKDSNQATWKDALLEGLGEVVFGVLCAVIGFGVAALFPKEMIDDEATDLFLFIGGVILVAFISAIAFVIHLIKTKKQTKPLRSVYRNLKQRHTVTLMTVTRKKDGKEFNSTIIKGRTPVFKFELSTDTQGFLLSVEYFNKWGDEKYLLVHPHDENDAIERIEALLSNESIH